MTGRSPGATEVEGNGRTVSLTIPAKPEYLVLARLALSAVCRLTPLQPEEVADLKLAVTEAATGRISAAARGGDTTGEEPPPIALMFSLGDEELVLEVQGAAGPAGGDDEWELGRAIIEATVDHCTESEESIRLVKFLNRPAE
jgi:hypothetical protein